MQDKWQKIFSESRFIPNNNLENLLLLRLQKRIKLINQIKFISYLTTNVTSVIFLFISAKFVYNDLYNSGALNYFHLIISEDLSTIALLWKDITYALFESLPVMSITLALGLIFMFMVSLNGVLLSRKSFLKIN